MAAITTAAARAAVVDTVLCLAVEGLLVGVAFVDIGLLVAVWLIPWLLALVVFVPLVLVTEHYGATVGTVDAAENTRTVVSNRLVRWVYWNNNFHMEHHQSPTVVFQALPELDSSTGDRQAGPWVSAGYVAFHQDIWRSLPWRAPADDRAKGTV